MSPDIIGIDLGAKGCICVFNVKKEKIIDFWDINLKKYDINYYLEALGKYKNSLCIVEQLCGYNMGGQSAFSFGRTIGYLHALCDVLNLEVHEITPSKWKKHFNLIMPKTKHSVKKEASRKLAMELFPEMRENLQRVKDHDRAEAFLLALYGYQTLQ